MQDCLRDGQTLTGIGRSHADSRSSAGTAGRGTMVPPRPGFGMTNGVCTSKEVDPGASDKLSDYGARQYQTEHDVLRHGMPSDLR